MIDAKKITPLLSGMTIKKKIGRGPNSSVYLAVKGPEQTKYAVKHVSIPSSDAKTKALIYSGAVKTEYEAQKYYSNLIADYKSELLLMNKVKNAPNLLKFRGYQIDQKALGVGYDVYLLSNYAQNLIDYLEIPISKVNAVNLGIDLAEALEQLRTENLIHKDVHPSNIFCIDGQRFALGDLGATEADGLQYSTLPDAMITAFTAPEVLPDDACLSSTMDIYSVGVILYMVYNGNDLPLDDGGHFRNTADEELPAPLYADQDMAAIILKACAFNPKDRYQTPSELKEALVLYAQSGDVSDDYLVPQPEPELAEEAVSEQDSEPTSGDTVVIPAMEAVEALSDTVTGDTAVVPAAETEEPLSENAAEIPDAAAPTAVPEETMVFPSTAEAVEDTIIVPTLPVKEPDLLTSPDVPEKETVGALSQLDNDDMIMPSSGEISVQNFLAALRKQNVVEVCSMDGDGSLTAVPQFTLTDEVDDDYAESADAAFEGSATPVIVPELTVEIPVDEAEASDDAAAGTIEAAEPVLTVDYAEEAAPGFIPEPSSVPEQDISDLVNAVAAHINTEIPADPDLSTPGYTVPEEQYTDPVPPVAIPEMRSSTPVYDDSDDDEYDEDFEDDFDEEDDKPKGSAWKKVLITVIVLLVLAGGAFGFYYFFTDTVTGISAEANSSTSITVTANTQNSSAMDVVCSTPAGEVARETLSGNEATFTDLSANTTYTFSLVSDENKFLLGSKSTSAKTNQMTNLNAFSVVSYSAVGAKLSIAGTGPQPDSWILNIIADSGDTQTVEVTGTEFDITDLTPATNYTVSIEKGDGDVLGGTTACTFTTQEYTVIGSFAETEITTDSMSLAWSFTGTAPSSWTLTCEGTDGSSTTQTVSDTECTLTGLNPGVTYTLSLDTPSLLASDANTIEVTIPSITVTSVSSTAEDSGSIKVNWEYTGDFTPEQWTLTYTYDDTVAPVTVTSNTNSITLDGLIPGTSYTISITNADELTIGGEGTTTCSTGAAEAYSEYGCNGAELLLYVLEDNEDSLSDPSDVFTTTEHIAFTIEVNYDETEEDKTAATMYVIRDKSTGIPVRVYESSRTWSGSWTTARHSGNIPDSIEVPGSYTMEVYFDGGLMDSADFTVE